jgi:hypothetical protein
VVVVVGGGGGGGSSGGGGGSGGALKVKLTNLQIYFPTLILRRKCKQICSTVTSFRTNGVVFRGLRSLFGQHPPVAIDCSMVGVGGGNRLATQTWRCGTTDSSCRSALAVCCVSLLLGVSEKIGCSSSLIEPRREIPS